MAITYNQILEKVEHYKKTHRPYTADLLVLPSDAKRALFFDLYNRKMITKPMHLVSREFRLCGCNVLWSESLLPDEVIVARTR